MPEVYARNFAIVPHDGIIAAESFARCVQHWVGARWPDSESELQATEPRGFRGGDGSVFRWEPFIEGSDLLLEFTWRHHDVASSAIWWSTQVALYSVGSSLKASVRITNSGPEIGDAGQRLTTRPRLVGSLLKDFQLSTSGFQLNETAKRLGKQAAADFIRYELLDPERTYPILLITPLADGTFVVPPDQLANEFLSLCQVVALEEPQDTFSLTRLLGGKPLSCFYGAARVYRQGLNARSTPERHPLLFPGTLRNARARLPIAELLSLASAVDFAPDTRLSVLRDERSLRAQEVRASLNKQLHRAQKDQADLGTWRALAEDYATANKKLEAEKAGQKDTSRELQDRLTKAIDKASALSYALRTAKGEESVDGHNGKDAQPKINPTSVREAVDAAFLLHEEQLYFLPSAFDSADASPFARPDRVLAVLAAMADVASKRRKASLGRNLKDEFGSLGHDYRTGISATTPRSIRRQYQFQEDGAVYTCEEHMCLGGSSADPANNLRIYFTTDGRDDGRFVVAHVGRHLDVISTN